MSDGHKAIYLIGVSLWAMSPLSKGLLAREMASRHGFSLSIHGPIKTKTINIPLRSIQQCLKIAIQLQLKLRRAWSWPSRTTGQGRMKTVSALSLNHMVSELSILKCREVQNLVFPPDLTSQCIPKPQACKLPYLRSRLPGQRLSSKESYQVFLFLYNRLLKRKLY